MLVHALDTQDSLITIRDFVFKNVKILLVLKHGLTQQLLIVSRYALKLIIQTMTLKLVFRIALQVLLTITLNFVLVNAQMIPKRMVILLKRLVFILVLEVSSATMILINVW